MDYGRFTLAHADMTLEEFREAGGDEFFPNLDPNDETDRFEELPGPVRSTVGSARGLLDAALGKPGPIRSFIRRAFAETMGTTDIGDTLDMIPGLSELLLTKRNEVAMAKAEPAPPSMTAATSPPRTRPLLCRFPWLMYLPSFAVVHEPLSTHPFGDTARHRDSSRSRRPRRPSGTYLGSMRKF